MDKSRQTLYVRQRTNSDSNKTRSKILHKFLYQKINLNNLLSLNKRNIN